MSCISLRGTCDKNLASIHQVSNEKLDFMRFHFLPPGGKRMSDIGPIFGMQVTIT